MPDAPDAPDVPETWPARVGQIRLCELRVTCIVGVLPHEREREQDIFITVELDHDFAAAAASEDVAATVDYAALADDLSAWIRARKFRLIETLAVEGCARILARSPGVSRVRLTVEKPEAIAAARHAAVSFEQVRALA